MLGKSWNWVTTGQKKTKTSRLDRQCRLVKRWRLDSVTHDHLCYIIVCQTSKFISVLLLTDEKIFNIFVLINRLSRLFSSSTTVSQFFLVSPLTFSRVTNKRVKQFKTFIIKGNNIPTCPSVFRSREELPVRLLSFRRLDRWKGEGPDSNHGQYLQSNLNPSLKLKIMLY